MLILLLLATCFLAYANGANDNFKGVASLLGSRTASYRAAIGWATVTTFAGSVCAIFAAQALLRAFSGKDLVPDHIVSSGYFLLAVALGAGLTVIAATLLGFPVSTTHALTGAIVGGGYLASDSGVNLDALGSRFILPLLLSPLLAGLLSGGLYLILRFLRIRLGISKEWCVCIGAVQRLVPMPQPNSAFALEPVSRPALAVSTGISGECSQQYAGRFLGFESQKVMDGLHFLSAGVVSFARGLNDTPKIAALLLAIHWLDSRVGMASLATAMAIGGLLNATKVAETMSLKITSMDHGQGFAANLSTGILVILASIYGLPVSTTHVSVGALAGIGFTRRQADTKVLRGIVLSWVLTLPCAALAAALIYSVAARI